MTITVDPVANTDTFGTWLTRTNILAAIATQNAVTVDSTAGGSISTGNAYVNGFFGANTVVAFTGIAGGSLPAGNTLNLLTNTVFGVGGSNVVMMTANSFSANVVITSNAVTISTVNGNTSVTAANFFNVNASTVNVRSTSFNANGVTTLTGNTSIKANSTFNVLTVTGNTTATVVLANTTNTIIVGNTFLANSLVVNGSIATSNLSVTGPVAFSNTLSVAGGANVVGTANIGGNLNVAGRANVAGNMAVDGNLLVVGSLTYEGTATGNLVPTSPSEFNIGDSTSNWQYGYFDYVLASNSVSTINVIATGTSTLNTVSVANTLSVTRAATLSNTISVAGNATFSNTISVTGNATLSNTLAVTGNVTFANTLAVTGNVTVSNAISIAGNTSIGGVVTINTSVQQMVNTFTFSNSTATANVDTITASAFRSYEYMLQLSDTTVTPPRYHVTKVLLIHDGSTPYMTEYGTMFNISSLGTFDAAIGGGNIALQLAPATANVVVRFIRTAIV